MQTDITVTYKDGRVKHIPIKDLALCLNDDWENPVEVTLNITKDGTTISASARPNETDQPDITITATDVNHEDMRLASAELPNENNPNTIQTKLYAGYTVFESEEPIAMTITKLRPDDELQHLAGIFKNEHPIKYVLIDNDTACTRRWRFERQGSAENIHEHFDERGRIS